MVECASTSRLTEDMLTARQQKGGANAIRENAADQRAQSSPLLACALPRSLLMQVTRPVRSPPCCRPRRARVVAKVTRFDAVMELLPGA